MQSGLVWNKYLFFIGNFPLAGGNSLKEIFVLLCYLMIIIAKCRSTVKSERFGLFHFPSLIFVALFSV